MSAVKCPSCGAAVEWQGNPHRPFCSERCRLVDLGAWLGERYAIPGEGVPSAPETGGAPGASDTASRKARS